MNTLTISERIQRETSEVPLLNPQQKEALRLIDTKAKTYHEVGSVVDLVGVVAGIKPVAFLDNEGINAELVGLMGISCEPIVNGLFAASRDEKLSLELRDVFLSNRNETGRLTEEGHVRIGKLLGYPETATGYFTKRSATIDTYDELPMVIPDSLKDTPTEFFHQFVLSPDNYRQEIDDYVKPLESAVRELTPNTYKFIEMQNRRALVGKKIGHYLRPLFGLKPNKESFTFKKLHVN